MRYRRRALKIASLIFVVRPNLLLFIPRLRNPHHCNIIPNCDLNSSCFGRQKEIKFEIRSPMASSGDEEVKDRGRNHESGKYVRYTSEQVEALEKVYAECPKPSSGKRQQLIKDHPVLGNIEPKQIKVWFQNRRYATSFPFHRNLPAE